MLNLNWATFIFETVNFLLIVALLYYFLFRPIMRRVQDRAEEKERIMREIREEREEAEALREELEERLANAREEAEGIVARAKDDATEERKELIAEAHEEAERILSEAQVDAHRMRQQAVDEFHDELLEAILDVSAVIIGQVAPQELHDAMVKQLNDRIWELGHREMQRVETLRRSLGARTPTVYVQTAEELSAEQQGQLVRTFTALADRNVNLDVEIDPDLGVGLKVRMGDIVVDNSIAGKLEDVRDNVSEALRERVVNE